MATLTDYCDLHQRVACTLCDECGHDGHDHIDVVHGPLAGVWLGTGQAQPTCWAESLCLACLPADQVGTVERDLRQALVELTGRAELQEVDVRDGLVSL